MPFQVPAQCTKHDEGPTRVSLQWTNIVKWLVPHCIQQVPFLLFLSLHLKHPESTRAQEVKLFIYLWEDWGTLIVCVCVCLCMSVSWVGWQFVVKPLPLVLHCVCELVDLYSELSECIKLMSHGFWLCMMVAEWDARITKLSKRQFSC